MLAPRAFLADGKDLPLAAEAERLGIAAPSHPRSHVDTGAGVGRADPAPAGGDPAHGVDFLERLRDREEGACAER
jgi:hypothetical protein